MRKPMNLKNLPSKSSIKRSIREKADPSPQTLADINPALAAAFQKADKQIAAMRKKVIVDTSKKR